MKRSTKSTLMTMALLAGTGIGLQAQTAGTPAPDAMPTMHGQHGMHGADGPNGQRPMPDPARQTAMLTKRLALTPEQAAQVQPILEGRQQQMTALRADKTMDPKAMRAQRHTIMTDSEGKLNAVFNDEQKQKFAAMKMRHEHGAGHEAGAGKDATAPPAEK